MISVKGVKSGQQTSQTAEAYAITEPPRRSRVPYLFGAMLSAVALYIRSAMPGAAEVLLTQDTVAQRHAQQKEGLADPAEILVENEQNRDRGPARTVRPLLQSDQVDAKLPDGFAPVSTHFGTTRAIAAMRAANVDSLPIAVTPEIDLLQGLAALDQVGFVTQGDDVPSGGSGSAPARPNRRDPPTAAVRAPYLLDVSSGAITLIAFSELLQTASAQDQGALSVVGATVTSGTLIPTAEGFIYTSAPEFVGQVELRYSVTDGQSVQMQTARLTVEPKIVEGSARNDRIVATSYVEDLRGLAGNDEIDAGSGADIVYGGEGNDSIYGGAGNDLLFGENGDDFISGGAGNDRISGGSGNDNLKGEEGNDTLTGDAGNDTLSDGTGSDNLDGGAGNDVVLAAADGQSDRLDGGAGIDTLNYSSASTAMLIDLIEGVAEGAGIGEDAIIGFEIIIAGSGDDHIIVGRGELKITGGDGDDRFEFDDGEPSAEVIRTIHQILDFDVGDRIIAKGLELFEKSDDTDDYQDLDELRENDDSGDGTVPQIRLTYQQYEDYDQTVIEWDSDGVDDLTTVLLTGHHVLVWSSTT